MSFHNSALIELVIALVCATLALSMGLIAIAVKAKGKWSDDWAIATGLICCLGGFAALMVGGFAMIDATDNQNVKQAVAEISLDPNVHAVTKYHDSDSTDTVDYLSADGKLCHAKVTNIGDYKALKQSSIECRHIPEYLQERIVKDG